MRPSSLPRHPGVIGVLLGISAALVVVLIVIGHPRGNIALLRIAVTLVLPLTIAYVLYYLRSLSRGRTRGLLRLFGLGALAVFFGYLSVYSFAAILVILSSIPAR